MPLESDAINWLASRFKDRAKFDEPMSRHTHFKVGGPADAFVAPENREDLAQLVVWAGSKGIPWLIVGDGTNLLVKDHGIRGIVVVLTKCTEKISKKAENKREVFITAPAGVKLQELCSFAIKRGLGGMKYAVGIPGSVGGAISMNAGTAYGSTADVLDDVLIMLPDGQTRGINKIEIDFSYRNLSFRKNIGTDKDRAIILEGSFRLYPFDSATLEKEAQEILRMRKKKQPINLPSAGSFFKNPPQGKSAGRLIEQAGLKGKIIGGAQVSPKHANFIINTERASASDILRLMEFVQQTVFKTFNIELEPEVKIVGS
ncbi:MAG: UDP-N-acetylmuramate dehydrogenase [Thermodesulfobacteriota bacterium]|nr:UDP-N-acetylmuramate dehydrogenase [Thermodesulfobacteriota bacterium]